MGKPRVTEGGREREGDKGKKVKKTDYYASASKHHRSTQTTQQILVRQQCELLPYTGTGLAATARRHFPSQRSEPAGGSSSALSTTSIYSSSATTATCQSNRNQRMHWDVLQLTCASAKLNPLPKPLLSSQSIHAPAPCHAVPIPAHREAACRH